MEAINSLESKLLWLDKIIQKQITIVVMHYTYLMMSEKPEFYVVSDNAFRLLYTLFGFNRCQKSTIKSNNQSKKRSGYVSLTAQGCPAILHRAGMAGVTHGKCTINKTTFRNVRQSYCCATE